MEMGVAWRYVQQKLLTGQDPSLHMSRLSRKLYNLVWAGRMFLYQGAAVFHHTIRKKQKNMNAIRHERVGPLLSRPHEFAVNRRLTCNFRPDHMNLQGMGDSLVGQLFGFPA